MKHFSLLSLTCILVSSVCAETVFTIPQGYTRINIEAAESASEPTLTAFSVTLLNSLSYSGAITVNSDFNDPDDDTSTLNGVQSLTTTEDPSWSGDQWTVTPHLAYITDANESEEAFLITGNTASGDITLSAPFDLLGDSDPSSATVVPRFPSSSTIKIRPANTIGSIFSSVSSSFSSDDRVFVWTGQNWESYQLNAFGNWVTASNLFGNENDTVIFPDEGMFIFRAATTSIQLTLFGEVPSAPQISTITGSGLLSSRVPIGTTLESLGVNDENWTSDDRVFIWNQEDNQWDGFLVNGFGNWAPTSNPFGNSNALSIDSNAAIFINREVPLSGEVGLITAPLPYNLTETVAE